MDLQISRSVGNPNPNSSCAYVKITQGEIPHFDTMLRSTLTLTLLTEVKGIQREGSTLSHTPDELQILVIVVVVLGQEANSVEPAGVVGQKRKSVTSAPHSAAAIMNRCMCLKQGEVKARGQDLIML